MSKFTAVLIIGAVVGTVLFFGWLRFCFEPGEMPEPERQPRAAAPPPKLAATAPPVALSNSADPKIAELEERAAAVVVAECGRLPLYLGAIMTGEVGPDRRWVDVRVNLADPSRVGGHVLWYRIALERGRPVSIEPMKDVSADACLLGGGRQGLRFAR
jgi:hypothetical protein